VLFRGCNGKIWDGMALAMGLFCHKVIFESISCNEGIS
jgi:hypothetical protein